MFPELTANVNISISLSCIITLSGEYYIMLIVQFNKMLMGPDSVTHVLLLTPGYALWFTDLISVLCRYSYQIY